MNKDAIRAKILKKRSDLPFEEVKALSESICKKVSCLDEYIKATTILYYYPIRNEINILPLINKALSSKKVCLPKMETESGSMTARKIDSIGSLIKGRHGIFEPSGDTEVVGQKDIDFIIVPLVAFDKNLHRIGYGGGYYDRFLSRCNNAIKCGVAYAFQEASNIKAEAYDIKLDIVISEQTI